MHSRGKIIAWLMVFLVLPFVGAVSADNEKHPLHGAWISQSAWVEEYKLTFYPDGTFHILITQSDDEDYEDYEDYEEEDWEDFLAEADSNGNGVLDAADLEAAYDVYDALGYYLEDYDFGDAVEDVNGDGIIDQEEYEQAFAWEDFLAEADSNGNGVLDVEDFEAAQVTGVEDLPPSWDAVLESYGDTGDGVIDQEEYIRAVGVVWEDFLAPVDSNGNGVLDAADSALEAEDIQAEWDAVLAYYGDANGNGVIDQEEYESVSNVGAELAELMTDAFGATMVITTLIKGTWEALEDDIKLTRVEAVYEFNGLSLEEYYTLLLEIEFEFMVQVLARNDEEVMSEEEYYLLFLSNSWDSEGNPIDVSEPQSLEELKALAVDQMSLFFLMLADKPAEFGMGLETFVFFLDRDQMTLTHSDREALVFTRLDANSAIKASSWGQIKVLYR